MARPMSPPRERLRQLARERGVSLSELSRMLGRNVAYLQQFVGRGSPAHLGERDRRLLGEFLEVSPFELAEPEHRPGPPDRDQVQRLAAALHAPRRDRHVTTAQLAAIAIAWLNDDGGIR